VINCEKYEKLAMAQIGQQKTEAESEYSADLDKILKMK
jgi:hypothetical protein